MANHTEDAEDAELRGIEDQVRKISQQLGGEDEVKRRNSARAKSRVLTGDQLPARAAVESDSRKSDELGNLALNGTSGIQRNFSEEQKCNVCRVS